MSIEDMFFRMILIKTDQNTIVKENTCLSAIIPEMIGIRITELRLILPINETEIKSKGN